MTILLTDSTKAHSDTVYTVDTILICVLLQPTCITYSKLLSKTPNLNLYVTQFCFKFCVCPHGSAFLTNDSVGDGDLQPHPVSYL